MNARNNNFGEFTEKLTSLILKEQRNENFRYEVLLLIREYFGIQKLSFLLFDENTSFDKNYRDALLNNVTLGLDREAVEEYYNNFYLIDPLHNSINLDRLENKTEDYLSIDDFFSTEFYKEFYKKYDSFYIFSRGIVYNKKIIGILTFIKDTEDGNFSKQEEKELLMATQIISNELAKVIIYERLSLENKTLKESEKYFPIAKIVLDYDYNIIYNDKLAQKYITKITGSNKSQSFKFFVINEMVTTGLLTGDKRVTSFFYNDYIFVVSKDFNIYNSEHTDEYYYSMFILKRPVIDHSKAKQQSLDLSDLTNREREVVQLIKKGLTNDEIAKELVTSSYTVKTHVQRIYGKLNVTRRSELLYLLLEDTGKGK